ncbi:hypothetical protein D3Y57_05520 [Sphingomonas paeninsulae]|uniref:Uncharacterized protein n=1 Tax=Sphingomonas paeninsulae TaxID=2319844 RepID=A0A494T882_SPHPE|nr:hypothetical protein D3Y57_05520 [Sphingomonas paeninsulae]
MAAASLLAHPDFISTIRELGVECFAVFTDTKPSEANKREESYNLYRGMQAIEEQLNARVQTQVELVRRIDADNLEDIADYPEDMDDGQHIIIQGD